MEDETKIEETPEVLEEKIEETQEPMAEPEEVVVEEPTE